MNSKPLVSIVIPCRQPTNFLLERTIPAILNQTYSNFKIIIVADHPVKKDIAETCFLINSGTPAEKRNVGWQQAQGEIIAFIDDDAYPAKDWLEKAVEYIKAGDKAVCGPGITPPSDNFFQQLSGWFWASPLGSGGAGQYRCWPQKPRVVDDYPTCNLLIKRSVLEQINGFDCRYWPGEDTKLCLDLVKQAECSMHYYPDVVVFHHRRAVLLPHLTQLGRYGFHRGLFARIFPATSRRIGYFLPALFVLGITTGPLIYWGFSQLNWAALARLVQLGYLGSLGFYGFLLIANAGWIFAKSKNALISLLSIPVVLISHLWYGIKFLTGLFSMVK